MKRIIVLIIVLFLVVGCGVSNTPTAKVEEVLMKYQRLDNDINNGINEVISAENLTEDHAKRYRDLLVKQYKNLLYDIKNELINGNQATVSVQVEVYDYKNAISDMVFDSSIYTKEAYDEEKLNRLEGVTGKVNYLLDLTLTKDSEGVWHLSALTNDEIKKIQGMY